MRTSSDTSAAAGPEGNAPGAERRSGTQKRPAASRRQRLDAAVVDHGLAPSRERARALIMAGEVRVQGKMVDKPGTLIAPDAVVALAGPAAELRYASRGGLKLEHALDAFELNPADAVCLDVGASTGGFTDVLLRRGAARVYAVDVGRGQLAWNLRIDARVVVLDRTNIRYLTNLPEPIACAVIDVSFISLRLVLPAVAALLAPGAWVVALVKPQFEAGRAEASRGAGVITDPAVHRRVLAELLAWLDVTGSGAVRRLVARGLVASPITGRDGNREYLLALAENGQLADDTGAEPAASPLAGAVTASSVAAVIASAFGAQDPTARGDQARRGSRDA
jgi:23S rRNA (cytidine1920-2'-O)/16S rRNA (cytidine1409-2'-O)-methyltransferase